MILFRALSPDASFVLDATQVMSGKVAGHGHCAASSVQASGLVTSQKAAVLVICVGRPYELLLNALVR